MAGGPAHLLDGSTIRGLNVLGDAIGTLVPSMLRASADEIEPGALMLADEGRVRVRILPLNRQI